MADFLLSVVAPDRSVVEDSVQAVTLPGLNGYLGIWAGHEPTVVALKPGLLEYIDKTSNRHVVNVTGGFAEITGTRVTVLADAAERAKEIDIARAERALENARKTLRGEMSGTGTEDAVAEMERALARIKAAKS